MQPTLDNDDRTANDYTCPVPDCRYSHKSVQGLMAHVGSHPDEWDDATREPWEVHQEATARDENDSRRAEVVATWLSEEFDEAASVAVYVNQAYDSVQLRPVEWIDDWDGFLELVTADGLTWNGEVAYASEEFVDELADLSGGDV